MQLHRRNKDNLAPRISRYFKYKKFIALISNQNYCMKLIILSLVIAKMKVNNIVNLINSLWKILILMSLTKTENSP